VNSVRSPASATNLVGFRPSTGLLSRGGIIPVTETQDTAGTLTRSVSDAAILLDICVGFDPEDKVSAEQIKHVPPSYTDFLKADGLRNKRLGLLLNTMGNDADVNEVMEESIKLMRENCAEIITIDVPEFESYKNKLLNIIRNRNIAYNVMAKYELDAFVYPHQNILVQHVGLQSQQGRIR